MTELNKLHQQRWEHAKSLFQRMISQAKEQGAHIMFDSEVIQPDQILIGEGTIIVKVSPNVSYRWFEADPDCDHGLYDKVEDYKHRVMERFVLVKKLEWA